MDSSNGEERNILVFGDRSKQVYKNMMVPERIVLSAGYDGDESSTEPKRFRDSTAFDEPPILIPEEVMGGMQTPPSVLTIDHQRFSNLQFHQEGDGADENDRLSSMHRYDRLGPLNGDAEEEELLSPSVAPQRSVVVVGEESDFSRHIPYDDPGAMLHWYERMQRRLTILETQVERQRRQSSAWKYLLLALTVINPIVVNYLFFSRRR